MHACISSLETSTNYVYMYTRINTCEVRQNDKTDKFYCTDSSQIANSTMIMTSYWCKPVFIMDKNYSKTIHAIQYSQCMTCIYQVLCCQFHFDKEYYNDYNIGQVSAYDNSYKQTSWHFCIKEASSCTKRHHWEYLNKTGHNAFPHKDMYPYCYTAHSNGSKRSKCENSKRGSRYSNDGIREGSYRRLYKRNGKECRGWSWKGK